ncbi:hypothetical protein TRIUR3_09140 [Triticum urartu]|uniref:Uncharacterized protein n=1 Tax=Triticum urartu TaxID=4572 RepID=M7ZGH7_TRIUA|nr:hypothetical protein TRIUR3_09140 [Triticum urartu]
MGYAWLPVCHSRSCQLSKPSVGSTADGVRGAKHDRLSLSLSLWVCCFRFLYKLTASCM